MKGRYETMRMMVAIAIAVMGPMAFGQDAPRGDVSGTDTNAPYPIVEGKWRETGTGLTLTIEKVMDAKKKIKDGYWTCKTSANGKFNGTVTRDGDIESGASLKGKMSDDGTTIIGTRTKDGKEGKFEWKRLADEDKPKLKMEGPKPFGRNVNRRPRSL
jgi:hypothetical protein